MQSIVFENPNYIANNWASYPGNANAWNFHEVWFDNIARRYNIRVNGQWVAQNISWAGGSGFNMNQVWGIGWDGGGTNPPALTTWMDNIYYDNTLARVMIGNASTYLASSQLEMQIPSSWSTVGENSTINVTINKGAFSDEQSLYLYVVDSTGAVNSTGYPVVIGSSGPDTTPPVRSNGSPSGTLASGTTSTTVSLTTNKAATCRLSTTPGTPYASQEITFTVTGGTSHSITAGPLTDGGDYAAYVRCANLDGYANTDDYTISWSVGTPADTTPPVRENGAPSGALPVGTTSTTMSLTTTEAATCKFSTTSGTSYAVMPGSFSTTGNMSHSVLVTGLTDGGNYSRYVRCSDVAGNANTTDYPITWSVLQDTTPPTLLNGYPEGSLPPDTTRVTMSLTTSEPATCKFSSSSGTAYASMPSTFAITGGTSHAQQVSGLSNGETRSWYVRCADPSGNATAQDFLISWIVGVPDTTPPVISEGAPSNQLDPGTTQVTMSVATDEAATCRYADDSGTAYVSMTNTFSTTGGTSHSTTITGLTDNSSYTKYVRCIDADSNANGTGYEVSWTVAPTDLNTYPEIVAVVGTEVETTLLTHSISIPAGDNGDLLMIIVRTPDATHSMTGWTQLATRSSLGRSTVFIRTADGSEGATASLTTSLAVRSAALAYRIRNHNPLGITAQFASADVNDPPTLTPPWSLTPVRWFAVMTNQRSDSTVTAAPDWFYGLATQANLTSTNTNRQRVSAAWRTQRVGTINPGAFFTSGTITAPHSATIGIAVSTVGVKKTSFIEKIGKKTFLNNPLKWLKFIR